MSDFEDTLAAIDRVVGCQQCGRGLDASVSDDFCSQGCQTDWHAARSEPLVGYREPDDLPVHVGNQVEFASAETTPRTFPTIPVVRYPGPFTVEQAAQMRASHLAYGASWVVVGPELPLVSEESLAQMRESVQAGLRSVEEAFSAMAASVRNALEATAPAWKRLAEAMPKPPVQSETVQERALRLRQNRNTGPERRERAPRRIDARRAR